MIINIILFEDLIVDINDGTKDKKVAKAIAFSHSLESFKLTRKTISKSITSVCFYEEGVWWSLF